MYIIDYHSSDEKECRDAEDETLTFEEENKNIINFLEEYHEGYLAADTIWQFAYDSYSDAEHEIIAALQEPDIIQRYNIGRIFEIREVTDFVYDTKKEVWV
jgi:hypothetical protein